MSKEQFGASMEEMLRAAGAELPKAAEPAEDAPEAPAKKAKAKKEKKLTKEQRRAAKKKKGTKAEAAPVEEVPEAPEDADGESVPEQRETSPEVEEARQEVAQLAAEVEQAAAAATAAAERAVEAVEKPNAGFTPEEKKKVRGNRAEGQVLKRRMDAAFLDRVALDTANGFERDWKADEELPPLTDEQLAEYDARRDALTDKAIDEVAERDDVPDEVKQNFADALKATLGAVQPDDHRGAGIYLGGESFVDPEVTELAWQRSNIVNEMLYLRSQGAPAKEMRAAAKRYLQASDALRERQVAATDALKKLGSVGGSLRQIADRVRSEIEAMEQELRAGTDDAVETPATDAEMPISKRATMVPPAEEDAPTPRTMRSEELRTSRDAQRDDEPPTEAMPESPATMVSREDASEDGEPETVVREPPTRRRNGPPPRKTERVSPERAAELAAALPTPESSRPSPSSSGRFENNPDFNDGGRAERVRLETLRDAYGQQIRALKERLQKEFGVADPAVAARDRAKKWGITRALTGFSETNKVIDELNEALREHRTIEDRLQDNDDREAA